MKLKIDTSDLSLVNEAIRYYAAYLRSTGGFRAEQEAKKLYQCYRAGFALIKEGGLIKVEK